MRKKFKRVYIEITNICNLQCDFCPKTTRKNASMPVASFEHIVKEIQPYTKVIYLHILGEPLLNRQLAEFLRIAERYGLWVNITTNGTLLDQQIDTIIQAPALRQINLSLHSMEANQREVDVYTYIKKIAMAIRSIHMKRNLYFSLRLWNMDNLRLQLKGKNQQNHEILDFLQQELGTKKNLEEFLMYSEQTSVKLRDEIYLHKAEKFQWPSLENQIVSDHIFCYGLRDHFGILVDGTVVPCCLDGEGHIPLGNIFEEPVAQILESERAKEIYEGFSRRCAVEELCKRCGYAERF